jgi:arylsulfatase A-like enzyme
VTDLYPTFATVAGIADLPVINLDGINVWGLISQNAPIGERTFYWRSPAQFALRLGNWKLLHNDTILTNGTMELYNMENDPQESRNIAKENPEIIVGMLEELKRQIELDTIK